MPEANTGFEQLKLLHDYTKFHIGLYATLITALLALMGLGGDEVPIELHGVLKFTTGAFLLAGACGGIVAASSVRFKTIDEFREAKIGPLGREWARGKVWASLEHFAFWVGIAVAVAWTLWIV